MDNVNFLYEENQEEKPKTNLKKWLFLLLIPLILTLVFFGFSYAKKISSTKNPLDYNENTLEPKKPQGLFQKLAYLLFKPESKLTGQKDDRINVLLLGMGGLGHDGPYLTDTIMIASIKPSTNDIALISIPRDLGIEIDGYVRKINSANSIGEVQKAEWGGAYATQVISKTFNLDIPYYIRIDFQAFSDIIDEVGGVRVNVDNSFTDYMYPADNDLYQTVSFKKGLQTFDGATALKFTRSRHGNNSEGSDFARSSRQQKIIQALKDKILSFSTLTNPVKIKNIIDSLEKHMTTNMGFDEILSFIRMAKDIQGDNVKHLVLDDSIGGYLHSYTGVDGAFLLGPNTGNFDEINSAIQNIFTDSNIAKVTTTTDETPLQESPKLDWATVEIENGTWQAGLAARLKQRLLDEKFFIDNVGNLATELKPFSNSGIYSFAPKDKDITVVLEGLQKELHIPIKIDVPNGIKPMSSSTDIIVVLGDDFVE